MAYCFLLVIAVGCILGTTSNIIHACNQTEHTSLLSLALTLSSPSSLKWSLDDCCCRWQGVSCDAAGLVTHLSLPSIGLKQGTTFHSSKLALGNLKHLTHLNLSHNSLDQSLASFLSLSDLEVLDLSSNLFSGELPVIFLSSSIRVLDLSNNQLTGPIPYSFFQHARNLTSLRISNNTFSGSIPSSLCLHSSPSISVLDFSYNEFNGSLSTGLGQCSKLRVFRAGYNDLSGVLPQDIYNATKLEEIAMPSNSLDGVLSDRIVNLTNLAIIDLQNNQLGGLLPLNLGKLSYLKLLLLHINKFEGLLPQSLMNCTNLIEINLSANQLQGNISMYNFSNLHRLTRLDLLSNNLNGNLPMSLYSCKSLKAIRLGANDIEGQIEPEILSLKSLSFLSISHSRLSNITKAMNILRHSKSLVFLSFVHGYQGDEETPVDFGIADSEGFQSLRFLNLGGCNLSGQIPAWLVNLNNLAVLRLADNKITGPFPSKLGTLPRLFYMNFSSNGIEVEFPKQLLRLPMLVSNSNRSTPDNDDGAYLELPVVARRNGGIGMQYNSLSFFPRTIDLGHNRFCGSIPTEIGQLERLQHLGLNHNNFSGNIPAQISKIKDLDTLQLSENHLSGQIPSSLSSLNFLSNLNVSYNNLEGQIPKGTQIQGFDVSAFQGNPKLCGLPLPNECQVIKQIDGQEEEDNKNEHQTQWLIPVGIGFVVGFWGVCGSLIFNKTWRYAYFGFIEKVQAMFYVMIVVRINKMKRRLRSGKI